MTTDDTLLTSDNHALLLIDHQYLQLLAVRSHSNDTIVNNTVMLAKGAKIFGVPTLFTTAFAERQDLIKEIQAVHPDQVPIDRTGLIPGMISGFATGCGRPARRSW
jgi:nicotinamidase-related amidase